MSIRASAGLSPGLPSRAGRAGLDKPEARLAASLDAAANLAFERLGRFESAIQIANHTIRLVFAGQALRDQMMRCFGHVGVPDNSTELTVYTWDAAQSGVPLPRHAEAFTNYEASAFQQATTSDGIVGLFDIFEYSLSVLDPVASQGFFCVPDAAGLSEAARAAPMRSVITWWLQTKGLIPLHAGVVGEVFGLAMCGHSGVGKSTTSLMCAEAGFEFVSDDYCFVRSDQDHVEAFSVFGSGKVYPRHLPDLPTVSEFAVADHGVGEEKAICYLTESSAFKVVPNLSIGAIVILAGKGAERPLIRPISPLKALLHLAPSTLLGFPGATQANLTALRAITERLPCFEMELASDVHANPLALRALLQSLSGEY